MKQYLFFAGDHYYPSGGWNDFRGDYETMEEVQAEWDKSYVEKAFDWGHVVDTSTGQSTRLYTS